MSKGGVYIVSVVMLLILCVRNVNAQQYTSDSTHSQLVDSIDDYKPSARHVSENSDIASHFDSIRTLFKPDPMKAVWMGAIIPGYGQIYNRKYWKLPIVYGGFLGCAYAIAWNGTRYSDYKTAYRDIIDKDPNTNYFMDILPEGYTLASLGGVSQYTRTLQTKQNTFRRYRDLSIIITAVFYGLTLVDAYVDAQLYDFDISPDLSMYITPSILEYGDQNRLKAPALQLTINL